jgi:hypothetical protein
MVSLFACMDHRNSKAVVDDACIFSVKAVMGMALLSARELRGELLLWKS